MALATRSASVASAKVNTFSPPCGRHTTAPQTPDLPLYHEPGSD